MEQQHFCQDCHQKDDCQEIYRRLGGSKCPPVFLKVVIAFLLPMVIFIISIAIFDRILTGSGWRFLHSSHSLQTVATFFMALITTVVFILFEKLLEKIIRNLS